MFAGHEAAGEQQLCSWWQIKTQRIVLSTGMRLTRDPERLVALRCRCVYSERIRRLQVGVTGAEIQSCHHAANLRYIAKQSLAIHYQPRRKKRILKLQNNFSQKQKSVTCCVYYLLHCEVLEWSGQLCIEFKHTHTHTAEASEQKCDVGVRI